MRKPFLLILTLCGAFITSCSNEDQEVIDTDTRSSMNDSIPVHSVKAEDNAFTIDTVWAGETVINFDQSGEWGE